MKKQVFLFFSLILGFLSNNALHYSLCDYDKAKQEIHAILQKLEFTQEQCEILKKHCQDYSYFSYDIINYICGYYLTQYQPNDCSNAHDLIATIDPAAYDRIVQAAIHKFRYIENWRFFYDSSMAANIAEGIVGLIRQLDISDVGNLRALAQCTPEACSIINQALIKNSRYIDPDMLIGYITTEGDSKRHVIDRQLQEFILKTNSLRQKLLKFIEDYSSHINTEVLALFINSNYKNSAVLAITKTKDRNPIVMASLLQMVCSHDCAKIILAGWSSIIHDDHYYGKTFLNFINDIFAKITKQEALDLIQELVALMQSKQPDDIKNYESLKLLLLKGPEPLVECNNYYALFVALLACAHTKCMLNDNFTLYNYAALHYYFYKVEQCPELFAMLNQEQREYARKIQIKVTQEYSDLLDFFSTIPSGTVKKWTFDFKNAQDAFKASFQEYDNYFWPTTDATLINYLNFCKGLPFVVRTYPAWRKRVAKLAVQRIIPFRLICRELSTQLSFATIIKKLYGKNNDGVIARFFALEKEAQSGKALPLSAQHAGLINTVDLQDCTPYILLHPAIYTLTQQLHENEKRALADNKVSFIHGKNRALGFRDLLYNSLIKIIVPTISDDYLFCRYLNLNELAFNYSIEQHSRQQLLKGRQKNNDRVNPLLFLNAFILGNSTTGTKACSLEYAYKNESICDPSITLYNIFERFSAQHVYTKYAQEIKELEQEFIALSKRGLIINVIVPDTILDDCVYISSANGYHMVIKNSKLNKEYTQVSALLKDLQNSPESFANGALQWKMVDGNKSYYKYYTDMHLDEIEYVAVLTKDIILNPYAGVQVYLYDLAQFDPATQEKYKLYHQKFADFIEKVSKEL